MNLSRLLATVAAMMFVCAAPHGASGQSVAPSEPAVLDPATPMATLPDLGVAWPDLGTPDSIEGEAPLAVSVAKDGTGDRRYSVALDGIAELPALVAQRFDALSALLKGDGKIANTAQIDRRAKDDVDTLTAILRASGYYDVTIATAVTPQADRLVVTLTVTPGRRYAFDTVAVTGLAPTAGKADALRDTFGIKPEAPVDADAVIAGQTALRERLGREGFPFAKVADSAVVVDHATHRAALDLKVDPGDPQHIGAIIVRGDRAPFNARHVQTIARFRPGALYDQADIDDLRRALIATGLVSTVRLEPEPAGPGIVNIATTMEPALPRTIAGELGYETGQGFRAAVSWQHRNLIRPEGAVTLRGVLGEREQSVGALLRMGNFGHRDVVLNGLVAISRQRLAAYDANSFEVSGNIERQTNLIWQKKWTYSLGLALIASDERDLVPRVGIAQSRTFFIGALPATLAYDGSDDLLNPTRGYRLSGRLSPEASFQGNVFGYVRAQLDGSAYLHAGHRIVVAGRARIGAIGGAPRDTIAPSRLFYSGGGGSVRGFGYQAIGPQNIVGQPIGGRSLAEFSLETRVRLPFFDGGFGIVPFLDAGNIYPTSLPKFTGLRLGAGIGLRYYSGFGPIRIDVGTPLARRAGESPIAVYVSLGQAF